MRVPKYEINKQFFYKDSEEFWYFAGFIASDGYISDDKIELCLNNKDVEILKRFQNLIQPDKPIYKNNSTHSKKLTIHSKEISKYFKDLFNMDSNKKHKEMIFPYVPDEYLKDFVRGVFDGDGSIDTTKGYKKFQGYTKIYVGTRLRVLGNYAFLQEMINRIAIQVPNGTKKVCKKGKENVWYITYNFRIANNIMDWMYKNSTIYLKRKYKKYKEVIEEKHEEIVYSHNN